MPIIAWIWMACTAGEQPKDPTASDSDPAHDSGSSDTGDTSAASDDDLVATSFGGCTEEAVETDAELGEISTRQYIYDANGDNTWIIADYYDDETFYDFEITSTYGAPHQITQEDVVYSREGAEGWTSRYTWEDGEVVHEETDYGPDGVVDDAGDYFYEDGFWVRWEWDIDGDGTVDDVLDCTWTALDDGWQIDGVGTDPNGPYTSTWIEDADGNVLSYAYEDSTGLTAEAEGSGHSVFGEPAEYWIGYYQDGEKFYDETVQREFDGLGRTEQETRKMAEYRRGRETGSLTRTLVSTFDCP